MIDKSMINKAIVCVIGLGYVGLPLAEAFSESLRVIGLDNNKERLKKLNEESSNKNLILTDNVADISKADFIIICVPTPVTKSKEPDLSHIREVARITGQNMKRGSVVILESTVYPGVTEEIVKLILEKESGFHCGEDFKIAYSPERINPGDKQHSIDKITKVVAGMDKETTELIAELYRKVTPHIFKAKDIKTAEAAKVIENIQRDLNIALINELALIFEKIGLNTKDVLDAAATKWNFQRYSPGLVGGHCLPVDPYYLVYKSRELGYRPQVILAGRAINDSMADHVAEMTIKALNITGKKIKGAKLLIMGLTYKENVADTREAPVKELIRALKEYGIDIFAYDPLLNAHDFEGEFGVKFFHNLEEARKHKFDCIVLSVAHSVFHNLSLVDLKEMEYNKPILIDIRGMFDAEQAKTLGFHYKTL
ncbi:nucleotide sugar dehydrogenase [Chloroflexota bacterium]